MTNRSRLSMICALSAAAMVSATLTASAQTSTSQDGVLTTSTTAPTFSRTTTTTTTSTTSSASTATPPRRKPTSASPEMINEAIQRTNERAAKELATGRPQQWGSEEPFTYNPSR